MASYSVFHIGIATHAVAHKFQHHDLRRRVLANMRAFTLALARSHLPSPSRHTCTGHKASTAMCMSTLARQIPQNARRPIPKLAQSKHPHSIMTRSTHARKGKNLLHGRTANSQHPNTRQQVANPSRFPEARFLLSCHGPPDRRDRSCRSIQSTHTAPLFHSRVYGVLGHHEKRPRHGGAVLKP